MAQAILVTTPQITKSNVDLTSGARFSSEHASVNIAAGIASGIVSGNKAASFMKGRVNTKTCNSELSLEAFPGELAALRQQASKHFNHSASKLSSSIVDTNKTQQPIKQAIQATTQSSADIHSSTASSDSSSNSRPNSSANAPKNSNASFNFNPNANLLADQLIEVMPTGLVMLDGNGIVVKINQVARNLLDEPILGQPWFNVIARSFNPREDDWHEISLKDGRRVKLEITSLGSQPGQLIMITDLTETRLLQDKIAQMQRLSSLGKMVSTLAHQIRTPLSAAILYGENLASTQLAEASRLKFQEKLNARLHDLEQQVNDMLLFSKSGTEQVVASLSVNELINDTVSSMDALLTQASANVKVQLSESELYILGNKSALTGAIQNLLHNSLRAISTLQATNGNNTFEPLITIQVYSQANNLYLSVKDNGPGIDSNIRDKIFQPFYTSSSKGTGLGLSVVKSVVSAHQGEVSLLNEPCAGAHFVIKLPLIEQGKVLEPANAFKAKDVEKSTVQNTVKCSMESTGKNNAINSNNMGES